MAQATYEDINQVLSDIINRIRTLESKYNLLGERLLIVNQNMIAQYKKITPEFKVINSDIKEIKSEIFKLKEVIKDLTKELQFFATKENIKVLEKYINLWNPMKFITEEELEKILDERLKRGKMKQRRDKDFIPSAEVPSPTNEPSQSEDFQDYPSFDAADSDVGARSLEQKIPYDEPIESSEPSEFNPSIMEQNRSPKREEQPPEPKSISRPLPKPQPPLMNLEYSSNLDEMEELVESVVEEKWRSFIENFGDIAIWKDRMRTELTSVKQELIRLEERFDNLQKAVLGRIRSYDKNILEVGSEIKALEKVFQNIIQPLNTNIKELSRITQKLKK